jgi:hypothetical protein
MTIPIGHSCDISQEREVRSDREELTGASIGWVESWRPAEPRQSVVCIVNRASPERAKD